MKSALNLSMRLIAASVLAFLSPTVSAISLLEPVSLIGDPVYGQLIPISYGSLLGKPLFQVTQQFVQGPVVVADRIDPNSGASVPEFNGAVLGRCMVGDTLFESTILVWIDIGQNRLTGDGTITTSVQPLLGRFNTRCQGYSFAVKLWDIGTMTQRGGVCGTAINELAVVSDTNNVVYGLTKVDKNAIVVTFSVASETIQQRCAEGKCPRADLRVKVVKC